ncbi:Nucleoporin nup49/NSP49 (Nuclear pore protein nup49/NSP49) [Amphichorda felina]
MSLARSASGPGGLSINTGVANTPSTQSTQPAPSGGLFGSAPSSTAAATTTTATTTAGGGGGGMATGGGLFGGAQQKTGTGLFGSTATTGQTATGGGGLFGNTQQNTQQTQGAATGGLFGNTQQNAQQGTQQQSTGGGLFGNTATQQQQQPHQQQQQQQQQQQTGGGGLFGSTTNTQQNTQTTTGGGGLFGQSQAKPTGGLFGQTQAQTQQPAQSTNQVPAVQINYDNLRPRTRFDDVAKPVQDEIALIDKGIARVIKMKDQIGEFMPQHERDIEQLGRDVKFVESKFRTVQVALNNDIQTVKALQDLTKKNIADAQLSFKATDNLKLPAHYHQTGLFASTSASGNNAAAAAAAGSGSAADASGTHADAQDLISYFNRICDDVERYKKRLDEYRAEIERDMPGVENGLYEQIRTLRDRHAASGGGEGPGGGGSVSDQLGQVLMLLREMGTAIVNQAGQIADTRERLSRLQSGFLDSGMYAMGMAA